MYDLLDPKELSDEEIEAKIFKSNQMLNTYTGKGAHFQQAIIQLEALLGVLGEELEYRRKTKAEESRKEVEKQSVSRYGRKKRSKQKPKNPNIVATLGHIKGVDD